MNVNKAYRDFSSDLSGIAQRILKAGSQSLKDTGLHPESSKLQITVVCFSGATLLNYLSAFFQTSRSGVCLCLY